MAAAIETGVSLRTFNTFGVEARAAFFASVRDVEQLARCAGAIHASSTCRA